MSAAKGVPVDTKFTVKANNGNPCQMAFGLCHLQTFCKSVFLFVFVFLFILWMCGSFSNCSQAFSQVLMETRQSHSKYRVAPSFFKNLDLKGD